MTHHAFIVIRLGNRFRSTVVSATEISCRLTRIEAFEVSDQTRNLETISQLNAVLQALTSRPRQILPLLRPYTLSHWSPPSRRHLSPPRRRLSPLRRSPPATAVASVVVPIISSTFLRSSPCAQFAKLRNARQTKMVDGDSNIQHRQVTFKNHCS